MLKNRLVAAVTAAGVIISSGALVACDREDRKDVKEGVKDVKKGVEKGANQVENEVDQADTDGKDD